MRADVRATVLAAGACAIVGLAVVGFIRGGDATPGPSEGTRFVLAPEGDLAPRLLDHAADLVRSRLAAYGSGTSVSVVAKDGVIVADVGGLSGGAVDDVAGRLTRSSVLELVVVDDGSRMMRSLADKVRAPDHNYMMDPGIEDDEWRADVGEAHHDYHLTDKTQVFIDEFIARNATIPSDRRIAYERVAEADGVPEHWRSWLLDATQLIDGRSVADVTVDRDQQTGRPVVMVVLDDAGAKAFAELTGANIGRKLAIVLDGEVRSAPVVNGVIREGKVAITMGGSAIGDQERAASALANALRAGAMPAQLYLVSAGAFDRPGGTFVSRSWMFFAIAALLVVAVIGVLVRGRKR